MAPDDLGSDVEVPQPGEDLVIVGVGTHHPSEPSDLANEGRIVVRHPPNDERGAVEMVRPQVVEQPRIRTIPVVERKGSDSLCRPDRTEHQPSRRRRFRWWTRLSGGAFGCARRRAGSTVRTQCGRADEKGSEDEDQRVPSQGTSSNHLAPRASGTSPRSAAFCHCRRWARLPKQSGRVMFTAAV